MIQLLIIADDFTGALDTGVQFSKEGISTLVTTEKDPSFENMPVGIEALVVDTESRHLPPKEAASIVHRLATVSCKQGIPYLYKKTDSTLRGNIGAELSALMEATRQPLMFVPAYPLAGRTTKNGCQYVGGVPLEKTAFARDPRNPMTTGDIAAILREQTEARVVCVKPEDGTALDDRDTIYVFDSETEEELKTVGERLQNTGKLAVTAGCAGFASHLAAQLNLKGKPLNVDKLPGQILLVSGSVHERSLMQLQQAESFGYARMTLCSHHLLNPVFWVTDKGREETRKAVQTLRQEGRLLLQTILPDGERLPSHQSQTIAKSMGTLTYGILEQAMPCVLVVFGGDTAMGIMEAVGCTGLLPLQEIEPGVAISKMITRFGEIHIISKAGGLGSDQVLMNIEAYCRRKQG